MPTGLTEHFKDFHESTLYLLSILYALNIYTQEHTWFLAQYRPTGRTEQVVHGGFEFSIVEVDIRVM
jgi:hypothetical protein